ncbi:MAG: HNH endonuclease, partial [Xanthobacteraceae bacterium]
MRCIFCNAELTADTKPEHILLSALGGRKTTRRVTCSQCNSDFGNTIDKAITEQVVFVRSLLNLKSSDGKPAPILKKIVAGPDTINIYGDGTLELSKPFT